MAHRLIRPSWTCEECIRPWPCPTRRIQFMDDYDGALYELRFLMAGYMELGFQDQNEPGAPDLEDLRVQLMGWLPPRRLAGR